jgi:hypothetical protein
VAELRTWDPTVTSVLASAVEVALVGDVSEAAVAAAVVRLDPDAVVFDVSDGWGAHSLDGQGSREAFARLSELELPMAGSLVGEVAGVGVRILVDGDRIDLLVPAMVSAHVRERIETDCAELLR